MAGHHDSQKISLNARIGSLALVIGAPLNLILHTQGPKLGPLSYAAWLGLSLGVLCFCDEMGAGKPLNRAGLVLFAAAFCADTMSMVSVEPDVVARATLLYAFTTLGALVLWSVALMHRVPAAKAIGAIGSAVGVGALLLLVAAHLLLGAATILGFSQLFVALEESGRSTLPALAVIDSLLCVWCVSAAILLWTDRLRSPPRDR